MSVILFVTDFSEYSERAFQYTLHVADRLRAKIMFLHVIEHKTPGKKQPQHLSEKNKTETPENVLEEISKLRMRVAEFAFAQNCQIVTDYNITKGVMTEEIVKYAAKINASHIITGEPGSDKKSKWILDDMSTALIQTSKIPFLRIPISARYNGIKDMAYIMEGEKSNENIFRKLFTLSAQFGSRIHAIVLTENKNKVAEEFVKDLTVKYEAFIHAGKITIESIITKSPAGRIDKYIKDNFISLVCLERGNGILSTLYHIRPAQQMEFHESVPLFVMSSE
ncbi:MAG: universal stress protein [Chitinophagales bacterium]|nr:universal stress protein [Chitinophagales bacterium]